MNGEVWGRGALDMLNLTASQAVALKALARRPGGWRPRGTLVYLACADEEPAAPDVASLALTTQAWLDTCELFLGH